jgi:hypothetical protein
LPLALVSSELFAVLEHYYLLRDLGGMSQNVVKSIAQILGFPVLPEIRPHAVLSMSLLQSVS